MPEQIKSKGKKTLIKKSLPAQNSLEPMIETPFIAGIGASAGGLEALELFFENCPAHSGLSFVVVVHQAAQRKSLLAELIQKHTLMPVRTAEDGLKIEPDAIYISPAGKNLDIINQTFQIIDPQEKDIPHMTIDYFFRSLAKDMENRSAGIILSGTGSDGTFGLKEIKSKLGFCVAQEPKTAKFDSMPASAIENVPMDLILPPEKMPSHLIDLVSHPNNREKFLITKNTNELNKIFILLRSHTGHDFSNYKPTTIFRRLERRMSIHNIDNLPYYLKYLQKNTEEVQKLFKELLIGVTSFFRDPDAFMALKKLFLSYVEQNRFSNDTIRVWVPGCATGEEAYSLAILLKEVVDSCKENIQIQIFATDIDDNAIERARKGIYPATVFSDAGKERLERFFTKEENTYRIKKDIREMIIFSPQDVIKDPPFTKLDILCCRNLLIYMNASLQKKMMPVFHYSLKPNGFLFLGPSESIGSFQDLFSMVDKKWKIYQKKEFASVRTYLEFPSSITDMPVRQTGMTNPHVPIENLAQKVLLSVFSPPAVFIDPQGTILYIHGKTGKYLEPAPGSPPFNILNMTRKNLTFELSSAIRKAESEKTEVRYENLKVSNDDGEPHINLSVRPVTETGSGESILMVVFETVQEAQGVKPAPKTRKRKSAKEQSIADLERELAYAKEHLQATIEEVQTANEELKSTNEELQSTNEELQSTNEELETAKEEQQSLNEELTTVNAELQNKNDELSQSNDDMRNLLDSIDIPTIFLDNDLCIKRFTTSANQVTNLIHPDIGRPMAHVVSKIKYGNLIKDAQEVLRTLVYKEVHIETTDDKWFIMRIRPYRTVSNHIDGVVITFLDVTPIVLSEQKLNDMKNVAESIVETLREPLLVLNGQLRVLSTNRSFYRLFESNSHDTIGKHVYELGNGQWDIPELRKLLEDILPHNTSFEDYGVMLDFPGIGPKKLLINARKVIHNNPDENLILMAMEDITPKING
ncbi:MAG: PAS domain-containing protein [Proteobacteria bacterium]|nr:PAS domain-containing protein [Pseudomonadota bacterium]